MNTKYFIILFFIASAAAVKLIDPFGPNRNYCRKLCGLTKHQLANGKKHPQTVGAYFACWTKVSGIPVNARGELDVNITMEVVQKVVPKVISGKITEVCNWKVVVSDARTLVEQAAVFLKCLIPLLAELFDATGYLFEPKYHPLDAIDEAAWGK